MCYHYFHDRSVWAITVAAYYSVRNVVLSAHSIDAVSFTPFVFPGYPHHNFFCFCLFSARRLWIRPEAVLRRLTWQEDGNSFIGGPTTVPFLFYFELDSIDHSSLFIRSSSLLRPLFSRNQRVWSDSPSRQPHESAASFFTHRASWESNCPLLVGTDSFRMDSFLR